MNIFVLDENPRTCAEFHNDKHIVKMILETAQLLSTAINTLRGASDPSLYKSTHLNHPCSIWTRASFSNFAWLAELGIELCEEYTHRYSKTHKSEEVIWRAVDALPNNFLDLGLTPFAQALPEELRGQDAVESYRRYYNRDKARFSKWTNRPTPYWFSPSD